MIRRTTAFWKVLFITCTLLLGLVSSGFAANFDLVLQWDENTEPDLAVGENPRYKIYYKTGSTGSGIKSGYIGLPASEPDMADEGVSPVPVTVAMDESPDADIVQFTLHNLEDSQSYYIAVTALDDYGNESDLSDEVSYEGAGTAPQNSAPVVASLLVNGTGGTQTIYTNNASGEVEVQIVASDTDGTVDQYLILDNDSNSANGTFASVPGGGLSSADFSVNYQLSGNGSHTLYAWVKDDDGSVSEAITKANIILDRTAPAGSISLSAGDTSHVDVGELTVTATFDESLSRAPFIEITGGGAVDTAAVAMSGSGTVWTKALTIPADDNTAYAVSVSNIMDAAGNTGQALAANFTTDTVDTDGDNVRDYEDADDDNDTMPDTWELQYGLNPKVDDAAADSDGDGVSNLDEYRLEMDPSSPDENLPPETPELVTPEHGAVVTISPELVVSGFEDYNMNDTHSETEWQVFILGQENGDTYYELRSDEALTAMVIPVNVLDYSTAYSWRARVYDNHGAASEWCDFGSFTTEPAPPNVLPVISTLSVNGLEHDTTVQTNDSVITVQIIASDADGTIDQYLVQADDTDASNGTFVDVPVASEATVVFTVEFQLDADGAHTIYAWVKDNNGEMSEVKTKANVLLDATPPAAPTLLDLHAADDTGVSSSDNITSITEGLTISGAGSDGASVQLYDGNVLVGEPVTVSSGTFSTDIRLSEGSHTIYARQTDTAGNVTDLSDPLRIVIDETAPIGSISMDAVEPSHVDAGELTITATLDEALAQPPLIEVVGAGALNMDAAENMSGVNTVWTKTLIVPAGDNAAYAVSVTAITDIAGNTAQAVVDNFVTDTVDTDGDTVRDYEDADDDNDGMPDTWELEYGLDPKVDDAQLDSDGDGVANVDEYAGQTDPTYPNGNIQPGMPVLLSPQNDAVVSLTPELVIGEFDDADNEDIHAETEWQIYLEVDGSGECVYELRCQSTLTSLSVPSLVLDPTTDYAWRVRVYDNHGAASEWSDFGYFTTGENPDDADNDGIIDDQVPDPGTDVDEDGTADLEQLGIKSIRVKGKNTLIGLGTEDSPKVVEIISLHSTDPSDPTEYVDMAEIPGSMPYGLIDFKIEVATPGDTVELTIFFSEKISENTAWYKYDCVMNTWTDFSQYTAVSPNLKSITLYLEDGGPGDSDGIANGIIIDPSGIVEVSHTDTTPPADDTAVTAGAAGGGGCFIDAAYVHKGSILDKFFFWSFVFLFLLFCFVNRNLNKR